MTIKYAIMAQDKERDLYMRADSFLVGEDQLPFFTNTEAEIRSFLESRTVKKVIDVYGEDVKYSVVKIETLEVLS